MSMNKKIPKAEKFVAWKNKLERILKQLLKREIKQNNIFKVSLLHLSIFLFSLIYQAFRLVYQVLRIVVSLVSLQTYFLKIIDTKNYCKKKQTSLHDYLSTRKSINLSPNFLV